MLDTGDRDRFRGGSVNPHFDSEFHFHGKFWMNLEYLIYPKYSHLALYLTSLQQVHFTACECV